MSKPKIEANGLTFTWNNKCSCYQFNLPPVQSCPGVVKRLRDPRSICNYCYAKYGRFGQMEASQRILQRNLEIVREGHLDRIYPKFLAGLSKATEKIKFFRWLGWGDVINYNFRSVIFSSALAFPEVQFWCPTQNRDMDALSRRASGNLAVRFTQTVMGHPAPAGGHTTLLPGQKSLPGHFVCPGKCERCRKCWEPWDPKTRIAFPFHGSNMLIAKLNKARRLYMF
jgi:hypothetical protein